MFLPSKKNTHYKVVIENRLTVLLTGALQLTKHLRTVELMPRHGRVRFGAADKVRSLEGA